MHASGRWHEKGHPIVYAAASASTALLEILVHLEVDAEDIPQDFKLIRIWISDEVAAAAERLSPDSPVLANEEKSRRFGTAWLTEKRSAVLLVPSVIIPVETNILINPGHPDAAGVSMISATEFVFDARLFSRLP